MTSARRARSLSIEAADFPFSLFGVVVENTEPEPGHASETVSWSTDCIAWRAICLKSMLLREHRSSMEATSVITEAASSNTDTFEGSLTCSAAQYRTALSGGVRGGIVQGVNSALVQHIRRNHGLLRTFIVMFLCYMKKKFE